VPARRPEEPASSGEESGGGEDWGEVQGRLRGQSFDRRTLTLVQGEPSDNEEEVESEEEEDEYEEEEEDLAEGNEDVSEVSTLQGDKDKASKQKEEDSEWDTEEEQDAEEKDDIENIDMEDLEEEIKLKRPTPGSKIADLTNIIEAQLHSRAGRSVNASSV
jgi:hypothetical protein